METMTIRQGAALRKEILFVFGVVAVAAVVDQ